MSNKLPCFVGSLQSSDYLTEHKTPLFSIIVAPETRCSKVSSVSIFRAWSDRQLYLFLSYTCGVERMIRSTTGNDVTYVLHGWSCVLFSCSSLLCSPFFLSLLLSFYIIIQCSTNRRLFPHLIPYAPWSIPLIHGSSTLHYSFPLLNVERSGLLTIFIYSHARWIRNLLATTCYTLNLRKMSHQQ